MKQFASNNPILSSPKAPWAHIIEASYSTEANSQQALGVALFQVLNGVFLGH